MQHTIHNEVQGSDEWLAGRNTRLNASELVLAAGDSMNGRTRTDLIRKMATGIEPEADAFTQKLYAEGHRFEALARPLAEKIIGRDLYPITVSIEVPGLRRRLGASLDGATDDDSDNFEHKRMNALLRAALAQGVIPGEYHWQMEQGQMINGATRTLFMASEWDDAGNLIEELHAWYESNPELRARIIPIWKQTEEDADAYQHVEPAQVATAAPIRELPALVVEITGSVTSSNLYQWKEIVTERIAGINTNLQTDQDFADADEMVKFLDTGEKRIDLVKSQAQANAADIDQVFRALDEIKASMKAKRLELDKLVTKRKEAIKGEIAQAGKDQLAAHLAGLNKRLATVQMPPIAADFSGAIKGKRNLDAMRDAVSSLVAQKKLEANEIADQIQENIVLLDCAKQHNFLFSDAATLVMKQPDDLALVIKSRISEHNESEAKRQAEEREKIRAEEEAKAAAKVKAEQEEAERQRRAEEVARMEREANESRRAVAETKSATIKAAAEVVQSAISSIAQAAVSPMVVGIDLAAPGADKTVIATHTGMTGSARLLDRLDDLARQMTEAELSDLCIHAAHMLENRRAAA